MPEKTLDYFLGKRIGNVFGGYDNPNLTIEEVLPYHDGVTLVLSNGEEVDEFVDLDEYKEPKHPQLIQEIYDVIDIVLETNPGKSIDNMIEVETGMKGLIGKDFMFQKYPCRILHNKDNLNVDIVYQKGDTPILKTINIYSLRDL